MNVLKSTKFFSCFLKMLYCCAIIIYVGPSLCAGVDRSELKQHNRNTFPINYNTGNAIDFFQDIESLSGFCLSGVFNINNSSNNIFTVPFIMKLNHYSYKRSVDYRVHAYNTEIMIKEDYSTGNKAVIVDKKIDFLINVYGNADRYEFVLEGPMKVEVYNDQVNDRPNKYDFKLFLKSKKIAMVNSGNEGYLGINLYNDYHYPAVERVIINRIIDCDSEL